MPVGVKNNMHNIYSMYLIAYLRSTKRFQWNKNKETFEKLWEVISLFNLYYEISLLSCTVFFTIESVEQYTILWRAWHPYFKIRLNIQTDRALQCYFTIFHKFIKTYLDNILYSEFTLNAFEMLLSFWFLLHKDVELSQLSAEIHLLCGKINFSAERGGKQCRHLARKYSGRHWN